jgi:hypothetical protein
MSSVVQSGSAICRLAQSGNFPYAKNSGNLERNLLSRTEEQDQRYKNPDYDPRGPWKPGGLDARNYYSQGTYPITTPSGRIILGPPNGAYWRVSKEKLEEKDKDGRIWWGKSGNNIPSIKRSCYPSQYGKHSSCHLLPAKSGNPITFLLLASGPGSERIPVLYPAS